MNLRDRTKGKLNLFLRVAIIGLLGLFIYIQTSFISDVRRELLDHRKRVEVSAQASQEQIAMASKANRARLDVGLCIFSVSPTRRTPEYVKSCYDQIEKEQGIKVERFGDGI